MDRRTARKRLEAERKRLEALSLGVKGDLLSEESDGATQAPDAMAELSMADQHPADIGTEVFEQEKNHSILSSLEGELHEIERALERVTAGSYGSCEACGRPIPAARLEAQPATRYCLEDQGKVERELRAS